MSRKLYIQIIGAIMLAILITLQIFWCSHAIHSSKEKVKETMNQSLKYAADEEYMIRLRALGDLVEFGYRPIKDDTSTFITKTIRTADTIIYVVIKRTDPEAIPKLNQYCITYVSPIDINHIDSLFQLQMLDKGYPVENSIIQYNNLSKKEHRSTVNLNERTNIESDSLIVDILNTHELKASVYIPTWTIMKGNFSHIIISIILTLIGIFCLFWRESFRLVYILTGSTEPPLQKSSEQLNEIAECYKNEIFENLSEEDMEEMRQIEETYEKLQNTTSYIAVLRLILDNEDGKISFDPIPIDLAYFFKNLKRKYEQITNKIVLVNVETEEGLTLLADEMYLERVFFNLLDNCVKFSNDPVYIDIKAVRSNQSINVYVRDNGWGIPEADIEDIFKATYQVKSHIARLKKAKQQVGYGLGLNFVESFIRSLRGSISVESKEGEYTEFRLIFLNTENDRHIIDLYNKLARKIFIFLAFLGQFMIMK